MNTHPNHSILGNNTLSIYKNNWAQAGKQVFSFHCKISNTGKVHQKEENTPLGKAVYHYAYDSKGHLTEVARNGKIIERYSYDQDGRRAEDYRITFGGSRQFIYGYDGTLIRVNNAYLDWTHRGQLKAIYSHTERIEYEYGNDTRLDRVFLPSGDVVQYEYANGLMPVRVLMGYDPVFEYFWKNHLQLQRCVDIQNKVTYVFSYSNGRTPDSVTLQGEPDAIQSFTGHFTPDLSLKIWTDQIGSIRALSADNAGVVKYLEYDAFGNTTLDTRSEWEFPLGFAGGLKDFYTGFIRFGFRDYDPQVGRFTAKDPIGDTGGDHDLWDYCVDDPVSCIDPNGLDSRSIWDQFWAWYSPLLFGNEKEQKEARERLNRSMKKESHALAAGFVDILTILPKQIPTSLGIWGVENPGGLDITHEIREGFKKKIKLNR